MARQRRAAATLYPSLSSSSRPYSRGHSFTARFCRRVQVAPSQAEKQKGSRAAAKRRTHPNEDDTLLPGFGSCCVFLCPAGSTLLIFHAFPSSGWRSETKNKQKKKKLRPFSKALGTSTALMLLTEHPVRLASPHTHTSTNSHFPFCLPRAPCHLPCPPACLRKGTGECTVPLI